MIKLLILAALAALSVSQYAPSNSYGPGTGGVRNRYFILGHSKTGRISVGRGVYGPSVNEGYGSSGSRGSGGYGSAGLASGYGSSGHASGYGSSGLASGYGSSGLPSGYGSSGGHGSSGYGASSVGYAGSAGAYGSASGHGSYGSASTYRPAAVSHSSGSAYAGQASYAPARQASYSAPAVRSASYSAPAAYSAPAVYAAPAARSYAPAPRPSYNAAPARSSYGGSSYGGHDDYAQPIPYEYGYETHGDDGAEQTRHESGDGHGKVEGTYGYKDAYGVYRQVDYVADHGGFRANVKTNEPGTANQNPADVNMQVEHNNYY